MQADYWLEAWRQGRTGFHQRDTNPWLVRWWPTLAMPAGARVLVPLCGKSRDMLWLQQQGYRVLGVELSEQAIRAFFDDNDLAYEQHDGHYQGLDRFDGIELVAGDFFASHAADMGTIDAFYDRAALVALPPPLRTRYVNHLATLLSPGTPGLLVTVAYDQSAMQGPPFSVPDEEVATLLGQHFIIESLDRLSSPETLGKFAERGLDRLEEQVYRLQRR